MTIIPALCLMMLAIAGCRGGKTTNGDGQSDSLGMGDSLAFETVEWKDSALVDPNGKATVSYVCAVPVNGAKALADSVMRWVGEQYGDSAYDGTSDLKTLMAKVGGKVIESDKKEIADLLAFRGDNGGYPTEYTTDVNVTVEYEDAEYLTMACRNYRYSGGAHGSTIMNHVTFSKQDGSRCGWNLLKDMDKKVVAEKIKAGLKDYFEVKEPDSDKKLRELLLGVSETDYVESFPLPKSAPYLTSDGVAVLYQQYEIAPYAAGMPTCVIKP